MIPMLTKCCGYRQKMCPHSPSAVHSNKNGPSRPSRRSGATSGPAELAHFFYSQLRAPKDTRRPASQNRAKRHHECITERIPGSKNDNINLDSQFDAVFYSQPRSPKGTRRPASKNWAKRHHECITKRIPG